MPESTIQKERFAQDIANLDFLGGFQYPKALLREIRKAKKGMEVISQSLAKENEIPGEEWFKDNFSLYLTSCQGFFEAFQHKKAVKMRVLREGPDKGLPLFYPLLLRYLDFCPADGEEALKEFISLFRERQPFSLAEVAFLPLLLQAAILSVLYDFYRREEDGGIQSLQKWFQILRSVRDIDMEAVFRETEVERILLQDPTGIYPRMEKESRALYRGALSDLARGLGLEEAVLARQSLELAEKREGEMGHFGYYLLKEPGQEVLSRQFSRANPIKKPSIKMFALWGLAAFLLLMAGLGTLFYFLDWSIFLVVTFVWPLWEMIWYLLNHYERRFCRVNLMPKLDYRKSLPEKASAMVVVSALLHQPKEVEKMLARLEDHFLSNRSENLSYAVMGDLPDSRHQKEDGDEAVIEAAFRGVEALNRKYPGNAFYFFFRNREYNARERIYMAWERKRGALANLNDFLRGEGKEKLIASAHDPARFNKIQYIIALDSDTLLPLTTAFRLIGAIDHPLQRPYFDKNSQRLRGHGIIAPRMGLTISSLNQSYFSRVYGFAGGLHPYITGESNFYQDLAGRGIFGGKGIYHIDSFRRATAHLPENRILSHDLLEGNLLNAAYASDIVLLDPFPQRFFSYARRQHRWVRGDFQLLPWLLPQVPADRGKIRNPLDKIGLYQIIDNLRRPGLPILLLTAIFLSSLQPGANLLIALLLFFALFPELNSIFLAALRRRWWEGAILLLRLILSLALMPYFAVLNLDAIVKTLFRLVQNKKLLEWETAAAVESRMRNGARFPFDWIFLVSYLLAGTWVSVLLLRAAPFPIIVPFVAVPWVLAPVFLWLLQRRKKAYQPPEEEREYLLRLSLEIWAYFQSSLTAEDHFLPPDNAQIYPLKGKAHRTSPSNIGLLLSCLCLGFDMGFCGIRAWLKQLESVFGTLTRLPKFRGHLYNWYDTESLKALTPTYVSTVDSGNFLASLYVVEQYLEEALDLSVFGAGRGETLSFLGELVGKGNRNMPKGHYNLGQWKDFVRRYDGDTYGDELWQKQMEETRNEALLEAEFFCPQDLPVTMAAPILEATTLREMQNAFFLALERAEGAKEVGIKIRKAQAEVDILIDGIEELKDKIRLMKAEMDFHFLYDQKKKLLHIGYRPEEELLDRAWYDQMASEIRLTSYLLIGRGELPLEHWRQYGRHLNKAYGRKGLLSWSGTAFEYFLPSLFLQEEAHSLLGDSLNFAIRCQKKYARSFSNLDLPWGISESAFYYFDWDMHYQYRAFGVPSLALDHAAGCDLVFAPYASMLAITLAPKAVLANLRRWDALGQRGKWGFYEAADFTKRRLLPQEKYGIVKSYMIHHQSMAFLALGNFLTEDKLKLRFNAIPEVRGAKTLLEEPTPSGHIRRPQESKGDWLTLKHESPLLYTREKAVYKERPYCHFLREGGYTLFINACGEGYSSYGGLPLNPWRGSDFLHPSGHFFFIADEEKSWSATLSPQGQGECVFEIWDDSVVFERFERDIFSRTTVFLLPDGAGEVRLLRLSNRGRGKRHLHIYSYLEPLIGEARAYRAHKGFYKLFFRGEYEEDKQRAFLHRRKEGISSPFVGLQGRHFGKAKVNWAYYGDREDFVGRGKNLFHPKLPSKPAAASLDPLLSLGAELSLEPGESITLAYILSVSETREETAAILDHYEELSSLEEARHLVALRAMSCRSGEGACGERVQCLTGALLYGGGNKAVYGDIIAQGVNQRDLLYRYGISGDRPVVLLDYSGGREMFLESLYQALAYWERLHFPVDALVLADEGECRYHSTSQGLKMEAPILCGCTLVFIDKKALNELELGFYYGTADLIIDESLFAAENEPGKAALALPLEKSVLPENPASGFQDGAFWIPAQEALPLPAPWVNLLANPNFGALISERGAAFTWWDNSRENPISIWSNDPVEDETYEGLFFLCDGKFHPLLPWSGEMAVGHGQGYTVLRGISGSLAVEITVYVPLDDTVKITRVHFKNQGEEKKSLRLFSYVRPVCGGGDPGIFTMLKGEVLLAKNLFGKEDQGFFLTATLPPAFYSGDRAAVFPPGAIRPAPAEGGQLGFNDRPLLTIGCNLFLEPGAEETVGFMLGAYEKREKAKEMRDKYLAGDALAQTKEYWQEFTKRLVIDTPDEEVNRLFNQSLLYQTVTARLWGRTSFYQCGGAFGFRDQLQDVLSLLYTAPEMAKAQILRHAARQFPEGDVLHWWHEEEKIKGVRTRFSDDRLWLPYVAAQYVNITGDTGIWKAECPYLKGEMLEDGRDDHYGVFEVGAGKSSLYEHCLKAIDISLAFGRHGLPLMGSGDWNDGMNRVGREGRGESVWLGFFLYDILGCFANVCRSQGEEQRAADYESVQRQLFIALNEGGYDGNWFLRAYFDDGSPLGSHQNQACSIDSISQSWAFLSGAGEKEKVRLAMDHAWDALVDKENRLVRLFWPPFGDDGPNPGYIRDYPPGIRENGGQYTHGALWLLSAYAGMGDTDRVALLLDYLNPLKKTEAERKVYRVEPYVVAADVYSVPPYAGRGGWSWYTGAASWFYRVLIKDILGLEKHGAVLAFHPLVLPGWDHWKIAYTFGKSPYAFSFYSEGPGPAEMAAVTIDGKPQRDKCIRLVDDGQKHRIEIILRKIRKK